MKDHASGPWTVRQSTSDRFYVLSGKGRIICAVDECEEGEAEANAYLMASAPDLSEALSGLYNQMLIASDYMRAAEARGELRGFKVVEWFDEPMLDALNALRKSAGNGPA